MANVDLGRCWEHYWECFFLHNEMAIQMTPTPALCAWMAKWCEQRIENNRGLCSCYHFPNDGETAIECSPKGRPDCPALKGLLSILEGGKTMGSKRKRFYVDTENGTIVLDRANPVSWTNSNDMVAAIALRKEYARIMCRALNAEYEKRGK